MSKLKSYSWQCCLGFSLCLCLSFSVSAKQNHTLPNGEVLFDPTEPYASKVGVVSKAKASTPSFSLNYIMSAGDNRRAMVNGKKVYEGDFVAGAKVRKITSASVSLVYQGKEVTLYLNKIKKIRN